MRRLNPWMDVWLAVALAACAFAVFSPALANDFVLVDDQLYVTSNPDVQAGLTARGFVRAWTAWRGSNYHPLTWLSHMADQQLWGDRPFGHHLTSVLLHAANVAILFLWLRRSTGQVWPSVAAALLFGLHPLRAESVAWVAERKDVLSMFFGLLSLWSYTSSRRGPPPSKGVRMGTECRTMLLLAASLLSKPTFVTAGVLFLLLDVWPLERWNASDLPRWRVAVRLISEKWPYFLIGLAGGAWTYHVQSQGGATSGEESLPLPIRCQTALMAAWQYLVDFFDPRSLYFLYLHPRRDWPARQLALAAAGLSVVSGAAFWARRRLPPLFVGWFWYLAALLPVAGLVQVGVQWRADRYTYLPQVGVAIAVSWAAEAAVRRLPRLRYPVVAVFVVWIAALSAMCARQVQTWKDTQTMAAHALSFDPRHWPALLLEGSVFESRGEIDAAIERYRQTVRGAPDVAEARGSLARLLLARGEAMEAAEHARIAAEAKPSAQNRRVLATALAESGRADVAATIFRELADEFPTSAEAFSDLAVALLRAGKVDEAEAAAAKALEIDSAGGLSQATAGLAALYRGDWAAAERHGRAAIQASPHLALGHKVFGMAVKRLGRLEPAADALKQATLLEPADADLWLEYADAALAAGRRNEARAAYEHALARRPDWPEAANNFAWLLATGDSQDPADAALAVKLAELANRRTAFRSPENLDTLAAAYANSGDFSRAIVTARQAVDLASRAGNADLARAIDVRSKVYQQRQPWREPLAAKGKAK